MKIRDDFVGITIVRTATARDIVLRAGDAVPEGVKVGSHLLATPSTEAPIEDAPPATPEEPASNAEPSEAEAANSAGAGNDPSALTPPPQGGAGSNADAWRDYAVRAAAAAGLNIEIPESATRADIIEALDQANIPTE